MSTVAEIIADVLAERQRQILLWGDRHDDEHVHGELAAVAAVLAHPEAPREPCGCREAMCPHVSMIEDPAPIAAPDWALPLRWKNPRREQLVIAITLLVREIERLERATSPDASRTSRP